MGKCIGEDAKYEGVRLLFDGLQQPVLNKQVHTCTHTLTNTHTNSSASRVVTLYQLTSVFSLCLNFIFMFCETYHVTDVNPMFCSCCSVVEYQQMAQNFVRGFPKCPFLDHCYSTCACRHSPRLQTMRALFFLPLYLKPETSN